MYLVVDVETTGLPGNYKSYKQLKAFENARVVSIAWQCLDEQLHVTKSVCFVVKPDGFSIPLASENIHGISMQVATRNGTCFRETAGILMNDLKRADSIVGHNLRFDVNVIRSELYRHRMHSVLHELNKKKQFCTMLMGKKTYCLPKFPKLGELYSLVTSMPMQHAHNAMFDVIHCATCFVGLEKRTAHDEERNSLCVRE